MNQLDFQVTIHIPENEVTPSGEQVILLLEQHLLAASLMRPAEIGRDMESVPNFRRQILFELHRCARAAGIPVSGGVSHGVKVEIGGVDINWGDPEASISNNT